MRHRLIVLSLLLTIGAVAAPLVVISIDGLDHRWLRDADELGLQIPNLRGMMALGVRADGVTGIVPTVTWPSHTTMITGVRAETHGIPSNDQPDKPGMRWWWASYLKVPTLWHLTHAVGMTSGAVWWPVTAGADINWNLPEFWDDPKLPYKSLWSVLQQSSPGLPEAIAAEYPTFLRQEMGDLQRVQATRHILDHHQPDLMLLHLGELDSEAHETGAFSLNARATLEYQDELLGELLTSVPDGSYVAIVSDHGFESRSRWYRPNVVLKEAGLTDRAEVGDGLFGVTSENTAEFFRGRLANDKDLVREVPIAEVREMAPHFSHWVAAFETGFGTVPHPDDTGAAVEEAELHGVHGLWPTREGYRAAFLITGPKIKHGRIPRISMLDIGPTFADILGLDLHVAEGTSFWNLLTRD